MRGCETFHKMNEACEDSSSLLQKERASRSRTRTRICVSRSTSWDHCFDMAPSRSKNASRKRNTIDAISCFLNDGMDKWHTVDILNKTITDQELE